MKHQKNGNKFVRSESRGATDWETLKRVRGAWIRVNVK
jgi:L-lactate dehydrogenase (cytochrome)